ncbi:GNAT family N-acetyltransferase [Streptomyces sp. NPDC059009]|uniref:GNAT family N-acetyltransferase n=1 Tax=Streptomyces sp. NPDC059009 TaxID=3346694 RepID=UPI00369CDB4B
MAITTGTTPLTGGVVLRPVTLDDAAGFARAYTRSRDHLRPTEPDRSAEFFTERGQAERIRDLLAQREAGRTVLWALAAGDDIAGAITLSNVTLGPLCSANVGYWVDAGYVGRGLAALATERVCEAADAELGLHRLEAGTLLDNVASQRVLAKCGFEEYGLARQFLYINGAWRDHRLFERILNDRQP